MTLLLRHVPPTPTPNATPHHRVYTQILLHFTLFFMWKDSDVKQAHFSSPFLRNDKDGVGNVKENEYSKRVDSACLCQFK